MFNQIGNKRGATKVWRSLGELECYVEDYDYAENAYEQAIKLARDISNAREVAKTLLKIGELKIKRESNNNRIKFNDITKALKISWQANVIFSDIEDILNKALVWNKIGDSNIIQALRVFNQASEVFKIIKDEWNEAIAWQNIGDAEKTLIVQKIDNTKKHYDRANYAYNRARERFKHRQDTLEEGNVLRCLAHLEGLLGHEQKANELYEKALSYFRKNGSYRNQAKTLKDRGDFTHKKGDIKNAKNFYQEALQYFEKIEDYGGQAETLIQLGQLELSNGHQLSLKYFKKAAYFYKKIGLHKTEARTIKLVNNMLK